MKIKVIFLFIVGLFLMNCKDENTIQQEEIAQIEEINTFDFINKSFEEKLNEFIDGCEQINQRRAEAKKYNITVGLVFKLKPEYEEGDSTIVEVTFMFYSPISCNNIIGMKKIRGYNIFYASLGEEVDRQIIKVNIPFNDCLDYVDFEIINTIFDPLTLFYVFENGELKEY